MVIEKTNDPYNAALAEALTKHKKAVGITFPQLAERTSSSMRTVKRYLNDERVMSVSTLRELSAALGLRVSQIVSDAEAVVEKAGGSDTAPVSQPNQIADRNVSDRAAQ